MTTLHSLTAPAYFATEAAAAAALLCVSKDATPPVLGGAVFVLPETEHDRLRLIATDRYTVGRYHFPAEDMLPDKLDGGYFSVPDAPAPHLGWWVPADALTWLTSLKWSATEKRLAYTGGFQRVRFEWELDEGGAVQSVLLELSGNSGRVLKAERFHLPGTIGHAWFPVAAETLIPDHSSVTPEGAFNVDPARLTIPSQWAKKYGGTRTPVRLLPTAKKNPYGFLQDGPLGFRVAGAHGLPMVGFDGAIMPVKDLEENRPGWEW